MRRIPGPVLSFIVAESWKSYFRCPGQKTRPYQNNPKSVRRTAILVTLDEAVANGWLLP